MALAEHVRKNLWLQVVISLLAGLGVGMLLGDDVGMDDEALDSLSSYLKIPANIFLSVIMMIIVPLIFASIVVAITNLGTKERLKTLGWGSAPTLWLPPRLRYWLRCPLRRSSPPEAFWT